MPPPPPPNLPGPPSQVYDLLKMNLSKYVLAVTVDDPASVTRPAAEVETPETKAAAPAPATGTADTENKADSAAATAATDEAKGAPEDKEISEKTEESGSIEAGKTGAVAPAVNKPDPSGPKCVQLKINPDWRRKGGGHKRRRGNLEKGGGRDGGRHAWPEGRPEYCRFVLYKENSDTVRAVVPGRVCGVCGLVLFERGGGAGVG